MKRLRILVDIGHPAHVHYFRNTLAILKDHGHVVLATARRKAIIQELLEAYDIQYIDRGRGKDSMIGKFLYMIKADLQVLKIALKFKPDLFLSFTTPYPAHVSFLLRKPHIAMNDTEHVDHVNKLLTHPFCKVIFTPESYLNSLGSKQIRFNNLVEGLYLHKNYYQPNLENIKSLNLDGNEKYVILRFVSWNAHHDLGHSGLDNSSKRELIKVLKDRYRVFITAERELPEEFRPYELKIDATKMHDVLHFAELFIGESSTMATESALLGTFAVYINSLPLMCNIKLGEEAGIIRHFRSSEGVVQFVKNLISNPDLKTLSVDNSIDMQKDFEDFTVRLVEYIETNSN